MVSLPCKVNKPCKVLIVQSKKMIVITGAAGFIASVVAKYFNEKGIKDLILVDDFSRADKKENYAHIEALELVDRSEFKKWLDEKGNEVSFIFHLGARTDTTEFDYEIHRELNYDYSIMVWNFCTENHVPLVFASSAATYGGGEHGYNDDHEVPYQLEPLNPYGVSKNEFDKWALQQEKQPPFWAGLKFFNVYGPNEFHKSRMASVVFHTFNQIQKEGAMKLFRSHNPNYKDGEQLRDFIYVKDIAKVAYFLMENANEEYSGLYNLGSGKARSFNDLAKNTFLALGLEPNISYIDTPADIRDKYQYFTEANMNKLRAFGYEEPFYTLEEGVADYVKHYLAEKKYY